MKYTILFILSYACIFCCADRKDVRSKEDIQSVYRDIFPNYDKRIKPRIDQEDVVEVRFSFSLVSITEIHEKSQRFSVYGFFEVQWKDEFLTWEPSKYGGVTNITASQNSVWRPELSALNTVIRLNLIGEPALPVIVNNDGTIRWFAGELFSVLCKIHIKYYPFDEQECTLIIGIWGYGVEDVIFNTLNDKVLFEFYEPHGEWEITDTSLSLDNWGDTPLLRVKFSVRRLPDFTVLTYLVPIILLSFLNVSVFIIPVGEGKVGFSMTVYLTFAVFLGSISGRLPPNSHETSILTIYLMTLVVICTCNVLISAIQSRVYEVYKGTKVSNSVKFLVRTKSFSRVMRCRKKNTYLLNNIFTPEKSESDENVTRIVNPASETTGTDHCTWDDVMRGLDSLLFLIFMIVLSVLTSACFVTLAVASHS